MKNEKFNSKFWGIVAISLLALTFYLLYCANQYFIDRDTDRPFTEEEKELIEDEYPHSVPPRYQ